MFTERPLNYYNIICSIIQSADIWLPVFKTLELYTTYKWVVL